MSKKNKNITPHDSLFKKVMENPVAAREFLDEYLPDNFKNTIDLSTIKLEKESFVEKNLAKQLSDVIFSVKTNDNKQAYVYTLIEAQVTPDYWIALRLWKYMLLLCERHAKKRDKLPLMCPLVFYHGAKKYNAPLNLWDLFTQPLEAKNLMTNNYPLVDIQAMQDNEINYDKHLSMIIYMMKHVHQRDKLKLIEDIFENCRTAISIDLTQECVYIKLMIWYTESKIGNDQKEGLEQLLARNLSEQDNENVMRTIAQAYIEEGEARGEAKGVIKTAINMLKRKTDIKFVSSVTGLSNAEIIKLKNKL